MNKLLIFLFFFSSIIFSQSDLINLHSPANVKKFGDYLFCDKDYLRAIPEYESYLASGSNDTVAFKLGLAYQNIMEYSKAADIFKSLIPKLNSREEYFNSLFQHQDYENFRMSALASLAKQGDATIKKLYLFSYLLDDSFVPPLIEYLYAFNSNEQVIKFWEQRKNPGYKSKIAAAVMSAIIPGAGKIYTEQYGDGITAFLASTLLGYLTYTNFHAHHNFRGWLFGSLTAVFYAGNIYGSAASAQIYNVKLHFDFLNDVKLFLKGNNFFMPDYNFCK